MLNGRLFGDAFCAGFSLVCKSSARATSNGPLLLVANGAPLASAAAASAASSCFCRRFLSFSLFLALLVRWRFGGSGDLVVSLLL